MLAPQVPAPLKTVRQLAELLQARLVPPLAHIENRHSLPNRYSHFRQLNRKKLAISQTQWQQATHCYYRPSVGNIRYDPMLPSRNTPWLIARQAVLNHRA
jgi:hypothetical protein